MGRPLDPDGVFSTQNVVDCPRNAPVLSGRTFSHSYPSTAISGLEVHPLIPIYRPLRPSIGAQQELCHRRLAGLPITQLPPRTFPRLFDLGDFPRLPYHTFRDARRSAEILNYESPTKRARRSSPQIITIAAATAFSTPHSPVVWVSAICTSTSPSFYLVLRRYAQNDSKEDADRSWRTSIAGSFDVFLLVPLRKEPVSMDPLHDLHDLPAKFRRDSGDLNPHSPANRRVASLSPTITTTPSRLPSSLSLPPGPRRQPLHPPLRGRSLFCGFGSSPSPNVPSDGRSSTGSVRFHPLDVSNPPERGSHRLWTTHEFPIATFYGPSPQPRERFLDAERHRSPSKCPGVEWENLLPLVPCCGTLGAPPGTLYRPLRPSIDAQQEP
ncbi:hypothetical protein FA13DRAFT_1795001 [Coprinellus micaceus]|uniref:Uncharacterized protein n=1 Tax=Coprinellus micaceus TaxID=71717 RepID=A0A4Y7SZP6_COPMI|nr:hypothetical protein FA13DRAFT_1795001 [Coprinellus micaceus]